MHICARCNYLDVRAFLLKCWYSCLKQSLAEIAIVAANAKGGPMSTQLLSIAAIAVYICAVVLVGLLGRKVARSGDMFNVFGRRAHSLRAASAYLGLIGAGELLTFSQLGYDNGLDVLWLLVGFAFGFLVLLLLSEKVRVAAKEREINTLVGYFRTRFGLLASAGLTMVSLVSLGSLLVIQFILGADLIASVTGLSTDGAAIIIAVVIASYLIPSGIVAVLSTDVLRAVMMTAVLIVVILVTVLSLPGLDLGRANTVPLGNLDRVSFFVLGVFGTFCGADVWQTVLASQSQKVVRRSLIAAGLGFICIGLLIALIGIITRTQIPIIQDQSPALIVAIKDVFPGPLSPLVAILITGSVMATADTEVWVISSMLLSNFLPSASGSSQSIEHFQSKVKGLTQLLIPVVLIGAVVLAHFSRSGQALYQGLLILLTILGPSHFGIVLLNPSRFSIVLSLWAGIVGFFVISWNFSFAIPVQWSLVPLGISTIGYIVGALFGDDSSKRWRS